MVLLWSQSALNEHKTVVKQSNGATHSHTHPPVILSIIRRKVHIVLGTGVIFASRRTNHIVNLWRKFSDER